MADFGSPDEDLSVLEDMKTNHDMGLFIMRNCLRLLMEDPRIVLPTILGTKLDFFNGLHYKEHTTTKFNLDANEQNFVTMYHGMQTIVIVEYVVPCDVVLENYVVNCHVHLMHVGKCALTIQSNPTFKFVRICMPSNNFWK